jgi:hypothetical protein
MNPCKRTMRRMLGIFGAAIVGLMFAMPASELTADICMQTNFLAPHPPAKQNTRGLGCTANDVSVAKATNITISAGGECHLVNGVNTRSCNSGQPVTFTAMTSTLSPHNGIAERFPTTLE